YWPAAWKKWIAPRLPNAQWTDASVEEGRRAIGAHLDVLESALAKGEWIVERYSLADICYAPLVLLLERVDLADEVVARPGVARWGDRLRARPAVRDTMMDQPAR